MDQEELRFPIGDYQPVEKYDDEILETWINTIADFHGKLQENVMNLSYEQLDLRYHPVSWNVKQLVHHIADSHINAYVRTKIILTESDPTIRPYEEAVWATSVDANDEELADALLIIEGLHNKWVKFLKTVTLEDLNKTYVHPEYDYVPTFGWMLGYYAWHCQHHLAQIKQAVASKGAYNTKAEA